ncbi:MAG: RES domain-containing protein [Betaproteobacteria bacterium]|nr:RES domain-containing protein [Betaproteobacteria bacterium]
MYPELITHAVDFHADLVRNIKGIRVSQNLFDDLSDSTEDQAVAMAAELASRVPSDAPLLTRPFDYGAAAAYPFVSFNAHSTRFSDGLDYGVWYGSLELETTVHETVHHWREFLAASFATEDREIVSERRVLQARCDAILIDLRSKDRREKRLVDRHDYRFTHALGRYLKQQNQNGLMVRSARCEGVNAALFNPRVLSRARDLCFLTYRTNPSRDVVRVERTPGRKWLEIKPSTLR